MEESEVIVTVEREVHREDGGLREIPKPSEELEIDSIIREMENIPATFVGTDCTEQGVTSPPINRPELTLSVERESERTLVHFANMDRYDDIVSNTGVKRYTVSTLQREFNGRGNYFIDVRDKFNNSTERVVISSSFLETLADPSCRRSTEFAALISAANENASPGVKTTPTQTKIETLRKIGKNLYDSIRDIGASLRDFFAEEPAQDYLNSLIEANFPTEEQGLKFMYLHALQEKKS